MRVRSNPNGLLVRCVLSAAAALLVLTSSGCAIHHQVARGYPTYLEEHRADKPWPSTSSHQAYALAPKSGPKSYLFRSWWAGYGNLWFVDVHAMLNDTLRSPEGQKAFGTMKNVNGLEHDDLLVIEVVDYDFNDYMAHVTIDVTERHAGRETFRKRYEAWGRDQFWKIALAGSFVATKAIRQSTKSALDEILGRLLVDLNEREKHRNSKIASTARATTQL